MLYRRWQYSPILYLLIGEIASSVGQRYRRQIEAADDSLLAVCEVDANMNWLIIE